MLQQRRRAISFLSLLLALCAAGSASAAVTISPLPGTPTAMPGTQISFLGASAGALSSISVVGSRSGHHSGRLRSYSSATGASFLPSRPFTPGEHVTVRARLTVGRTRHTLSTHFKVAVPLPPLSMEFPPVPGTPADVQNFQSEPGLHPPTVYVHQQAGAGSAPGYVFGAPFLGPGQYGPMIFDSAGNLVWFRAVGAGEDAADFQTQLFHGRNDLTWWQGRTIIQGYGLGEDVIANANYKTVAVVKAGNGMPTDEHEFTVLPNGAAIVLGYAPVQWNLSGAGGPVNGVADDCALQEVDIHTGLVMWEWRSLGHVDVAQSYSKPPTSPSGYYDYFHVNSAQQLHEGNFVISARNTWGIYEINGHTGRIAWQLGGKKSTFALGTGVPFAYQHNALLLGGDELSLFDDEGAPTVKAPSRGEIVKLDLKAKTATLASQFVHAPGLTTNSQGDLQSLPGGGGMVGWGGLPNFTEFDAQGNVIYDAQFPRGEFSYRVYREPWSGQPTTPPSIVAKLMPGAPSCPPGALCPLAQTVKVYASWNGATDVASWELLTGSGATQLTPVSRTPRSGFETAIPAPTAAFYEVQALSAAGKVLGTSTAVAPTPG
jgi:Arylsulfotransferase (ASST)